MFNYSQQVKLSIFEELIFKKQSEKENEKEIRFASEGEVEDRGDSMVKLISSLITTCT